MNPRTETRPKDPYFKMIESRERNITRLLLMLIASQFALAATAYKHGDMALTIIASLLVASFIVRLIVHFYD